MRSSSRSLALASVSLILGPLYGCSGAESDYVSDTTSTGGYGAADDTGSGDYETFTGGAAATGGAPAAGGTVLGSGGETGTGGFLGTGGYATGGASTGGSSSTGGAASCSAPEPPSGMVQTLDLTWKEMTGGFEGKDGARPVAASIATFKNTITDQIMEGHGTLNYCVRYESTKPVSSALRAKMEASLERAMNQWIAKLNGYDCFPYDAVEVKISGWATKDRNLLEWVDDATPIYVGQNDGGGAPMCPSSCSRFEHQSAGYNYPSCPGGAENHFDMSLWLTDDFGFVGGDWGQRLDRDYYVNSVDADNQHILIHEMGHGFGFPDYYNWSLWAPGVAAPACVMNAGAATLVTDWDGWMIRRTWSEIRGRFD